MKCIWSTYMFLSVHITDSLECGRCGEIFHQLEVFIKHKMSNCTSKEDSDDSSKDSKKAKKPSMYFALYLKLFNIYFGIIHFGDWF